MDDFPNSVTHTDHIDKIYIQLVCTVFIGSKVIGQTSF